MTRWLARSALLLRRRLSPCNSIKYREEINTQVCFIFIFFIFPFIPCAQFRTAGRTNYTQRGVRLVSPSLPAADMIASDSGVRMHRSYKEEEGEGEGEGEEEGRKKHLERDTGVCFRSAYFTDV